MLYIIISLIVHKSNITRIDGHQFSCELFPSCSYDSKQKKGAQHYFKYLIQVHFYILVYGSWDCLHVWRSCFLYHFLHVVNYKSVKGVPLSADWFQRKNLKTLQVQVRWWNGKQMCIRCNFAFLLTYILSFGMGFSLKPLCLSHKTSW